ncbi:competence type IV pilus minor pilin ComGF [Mangrovibacillus cuniculi]|uniref:ComGF family competence protein n=1 Tax=Mangrovibacillus cuniculi TaxID=2593652 RepID=A0A7S8CBF5_9BACI|nr:competence type IV pilus minor pilin ComGF [Mangrovibacillus cuniculi]QPC46857.1 ComGF family competence protein [Mangrovibacillus cuniculi]
MEKPAIPFQFQQQTMAKLKKRVCEQINYRIVWSQKGFTLLESLLSLMLFTFIILLTTICLQWNIQKGEELYNQSYLEWEMFQHYLVDESRRALHIDTLNNQLIMTMKNGDKIKYEKYGNVIRRRVNDKGHEPVLLGINGMIVNRTQGSIELEVSYSLTFYKSIVVRGVD